MLLKHCGLWPNSKITCLESGGKYMAKMKAGRWEFSEEELKRQLAEADKRGREAERAELEAQAVRYDRKDGRIALDLTNGTSFCFPLAYVEGLADAAPSEITNVRVLPGGDAIRWDSLDIDLGVPELLAGIFGTQKWMAKLGHVGGRVKSEAKAAAARENGKKGGRPPKTRVPNTSDLLGYEYAAAQGQDRFAAILTEEGHCIPACVKQTGRNLSMESLIKAGVLLQNDIKASVGSRPQKIEVKLEAPPKPVISKTDADPGVRQQQPQAI
jgi:Protein of unknown function (DUF2442)